MNFKELLESKDQLDISILSANKVIKTESDIENLLDTELTIEHKTDGTKLTVVHIKDDGDISDWIIAYKNQIMYSEEFSFQDSKQIIQKSIGISQYKLVLDHFSKLGKTGLPVNMEFAIEFLQRKPTLSSNYTNPHHLVLIGYSACSYEKDYLRFGVLKTNSKVMETENRDDYAKTLQVDIPNKLFKGYLRDFEKGIINDSLRKVFNNNRELFETDNPGQLWSAITKTLLEVESVYGGKEEGVVIKYNNKIIKVQQEYQLDQQARKRIKQKFMEDNPGDEELYWKEVIKASKDLASKITEGPLNLRLQKLSELLEKTDFKISHSKKNDLQIKDDIHHNAKILILKALEGNNGCLILGKFRVLTNGHCNVINKALEEYDRVIVCLVSSKITKDTKELRRKMLELTFRNKIDIIDHNSGNILGIISKSPSNINTVFCGSDRYVDYTNQLEKVLGVDVREYPRDSNAISATKVIANIDNQKFFNDNTPKEIHSMYDEILATYKVAESLIPKRRFIDYLREDGEASQGLGTTSQSIAPVTCRIGGTLRHTREDEELEASLTENSNPVKIPKNLLEKLPKKRILEQDTTIDNIEDVLSECLGGSWKFECFKCFKSIIQFRSKNKCFKIFQ